jgi:hypothetical protein
MYMVLFLLLTVVGGWVSWRRNPLFSVRSTIRFVAGLGLTLAAVIGAILSAVNFGVGRSQTAAFSAMGAAVVCGTLAMIWVIVQMSSPSEAPLPEGAKMLTVFRLKLLVWARRFGWAVLVWLVLELVLRGPARIVTGVIGGMFVFLGVVMLFAGYLSARQQDRWLSAVEADPWVHWRYSAEQWQLWTEVEVARLAATPPAFVLRRDWKKMMPLIAIMMAVPLFFFDLPWAWRFLASAFIGVAIAIGIGLSKSSSGKAQQRLRTRLLKADPEVYFGNQGIFADGEFTPWITISNYLLDASMDERPPRSLCLKFEKTIPGGAGNQVVVELICLPLPPGDRVPGDLARLQQELSKRCPTAAVALY